MEPFDQGLLAGGLLGIWVGAEEYDWILGGRFSYHAKIDEKEESL